MNYDVLMGELAVMDLSWRAGSAVSRTGLGWDMTIALVPLTPYLLTDLMAP